jgi:hypothetical protein
VELVSATGCPTFAAGWVASGVAAGFLSAGAKLISGRGRNVETQPALKTKTASKERVEQDRIRGASSVSGAGGSPQNERLISRTGPVEKTGPVAGSRPGPMGRCGNEKRPKRADKPGSVESGHFSRATVTRRLKRPTRKDLRAGPARDGCPSFFLRGLAPGGVCLAKPVAWPAGALLPHRFTLTRRPVGDESPTFRRAVCFLLHFPGPCGRWALPTTVSCGARTFLSGGHAARRLVVPRSGHLARFGQLHLNAGRRITRDRSGPQSVRSANSPWNTGSGEGVSANWPDFCLYAICVP